MPRFTLDTPFTITTCEACSRQGDLHLSHTEGGCIGAGFLSGDKCLCQAGITEAELEEWLNDDDHQ